MEPTINNDSILMPEQTTNHDNDLPASEPIIDISHIMMNAPEPITDHDNDMPASEPTIDISLITMHVPESTIDHDYDDMPGLEEEPENLQINITHTTIDDIISSGNYPPNLRYLATTDYLWLIDSDILSYIENVVIPYLLQYDYDKTLYYRAMIDFMYETNYDKEAIFYNIGCYKTMYEDDIENDMNIVRKYILFLELEQISRRRRYQTLYNFVNSIYLQLELDHTDEDVKLIIAPDKLKDMPIFQYGDIETKLNSSCSCCSEDFDNSTMVKKVLCGHLFHPECIDKWLSEYSYKCPNCRQPAGEHTTDIGDT